MACFSPEGSDAGTKMPRKCFCAHRDTVVDGAVLGDGARRRDPVTQPRDAEG